MIAGVAAHEAGDGGDCGAPGLPALWSTPIPGAEDEPPVWQEVAPERGFERTTSRGDQLFSKATGEDPVKLADRVIDVIARPR